MADLNNQEQERSDPAVEYGKLFRSAIGGFNRQDVMEYIERMVRDRRRDAERYSSHIRSLEEEQEERTKEIDSLNARLIELGQESEKAQAETKDSEDRLALQKNVNDTLNEELGQVSAELEKLKHSQTDNGDGSKIKELKELLAKAESGERAALKAKKEEENTVFELKTQVNEIKQDMERRVDEAELELKKAREECDRLKCKLQSRPAQAPEPYNRQRRNPTADTVRWVHERSSGGSSRELEAIHSRIDFIRRRAEDGLEGCLSLYDELKRNADCLDDIVKDINR